MKLSKRAPLVVLLALVAALAVAACGGSSAKTASSKNAGATSTTTTSSTGGAAAAATAFTTCLKQHGVTLPKRAPGGFRGGFGGGTTTSGAPTPPAGGTTTSGAPTPPAGGTTTTRHRFGPGGGGFFSGGGFAGANSKTAKAFEACRSKLPKGSFRGRFGGGRFGAGAPGAAAHFSDTALKAFVSCVRKHGYAAMPEPNTSGKGAVFPSSVEKNAQYQAASRKCVSILRAAFRPPSGFGQSTTPTTTSTTTGA